ncbi:zinc finger protein 771-like [Ostrinia nubilalis]|uniref:zinc finger protein 771-like n=1 Tax=Ostrinia nubilalis TaxID=29057 RepID=UPI0030824C7C
MRRHTGEKPFACGACGFRAAAASSLRRHERRHRGASSHVCPTCRKGFYDASALGEEILACGLRAAAASSLRRHERRHRGASLHVCPTCCKAFYDASALARHSRTHSGARPFACGRCARSFADSWKRKLHLMRAHHAQLHELRHLTRDGRVVPGHTG